MSCFYPLPALEHESGKVTIGRHMPANAGEAARYLALPCGRCVGCQKDKAKTWSIRVMHEAQLYDRNLFVTLDYSPEKLPPSLSLEYCDFQAFMRRLRKALSGVSVAPNGKRPIRFFVSGEYGPNGTHRPHWHAILFNCHFPDSVQLYNGTWRSRVAETLWGNGQVVIGDVTPRSAAYCAGYTLYKVYGREGAERYEDVVNLSTGELTARRPEFCEMSVRPGIGAWWYEKYASDLFPGDFAVSDGKKFKVPRYYFDKFASEAEPSVVEGIREARRLRAMAQPLEESTAERRAVRAEVARARLMMFSDRGGL